MQNPTHHLRPLPGGLPFNNLPGPLSPKDALTLPGDNIFKRIYWASVMWKVALKAEAEKQITGHVIEQRALEKEIQEEMEHRQHSSKRKGHIGRQDGGPGHEEGFDAGEIDQFDNGPEIPETKKDQDDTSIRWYWLIRIIRIYYITYLMIYNMIGLKRNEEGELSDKALDDWLESNQNNIVFRQVKMHLLNSLSQYSSVFDLSQIQFSERFLDRLSATLTISGKTLEDIQAVDQQALGQAVATAHAEQLAQMAEVTHDMVLQTTNALNAAGVPVKPAVQAPVLTPASFTKAVASMGQPQHPVEPVQQLTMERLATVKSMFPNVPKPQNTQRREHAKHSKKDVAPMNTNKNMGKELEDYANAIGVDPRVLEQGADHTRLKALGQDGPEHASSHSAMREMTAISGDHKPSSSDSRPPMRPMPPPVAGS